MRLIQNASHNCSKRRLFKLALMLTLLCASGCSAQKKIMAKPYSAVYEISPASRVYSNATRISDGAGRIRTELKKRDGKVEIKISDTKNLKVCVLYPESKIFVVRDMEGHELVISESFDGVAFDAPKEPVWKYKSSGKTGKYKTQLWVQDQGGGNFKRTTSLQYGEDIGCPVSIHFFESDIPDQATTFFLSEFSTAKPDDSNFAPPSDYEKR